MSGTVTRHVVRTVCPGSTRSNVAGEVAATGQPSGADSAIVYRYRGASAVLRNSVVAAPVDPASARLGASRTSPPPTTTTAAPSPPSTVAVTVATPSPTAVACPVPSTVSTAGSLVR